MEKYCNNCGNYGHYYRQCKHPVLSYGIILFNLEENKEPEIVMIERKDSISYIEFLRGKYKSIYSIDYLILLFSRFTEKEKKDIITYDFESLWNNLWIHTDTINKNVRKEYKNSFEKFNKLKQGFQYKDKLINLEYLLSNVNTNYKMNEWEIPKGRRLSKESNKACAIREFEEETNILNEKFIIYNNVAPIIEEYRGINNIPYKHVYYIAKIKEKVEVEINLNNKDQYTEVKNIKWVKKSEALNNIRDYDDNKKKVINDIFMFISNNKNYLFL